jgi:hypothetical protein
VIAERLEIVRQLLSGARPKLDALAEALLKNETIGEDALGHMLGPRPAPVELPSST